MAEHNLSTHINLPNDLIRQLACDSYRARQLLRLTCKTYYNMLGTWCPHSSKFACCVGGKYRASFIKATIIAMKKANKCTEYIKTIIRDEQCIRFSSESCSFYTLEGIHLLIDEPHGPHICALQAGDVKYKYLSFSPVQVEFCDEKYKLLSFSKMVGAREYLRDHLPELHYRMKFDV